MSTVYKCLATCSVLLCLAHVGALRAAEMTIAVIDVARVVKAYPETAAAQAVLIKQKEESEARHEKLMDKGAKLKDEFEDLRTQAESRALSEEARRDKVKEARAMMQELVELEREVRESSRARKRELAEEEVRLMSRIYNDLSTKIEEYVEEHKFTLVLNSAAIGMSGSAVVVYSDEKIDITADIIKLTGGTEEKDDE